MPLSEVQRVEGLTASASSGSLAYTSSNTSGNLLVAYFATIATASTISSVHDTAGNTWNLRFYETNENVSLFCYDCLNCVSGSNTVTVAGSFTNPFIDIMLFEFTSSIAGPWSFNTFSNAGLSNGMSASANSGVVTVIQANAVLVAACVTQATSVTAGSGGSWTGEVGTGSPKVWKEYQITGPGTYSATFTVASATDWTCGIGAWYQTGILQLVQNTNGHVYGSSTLSVAYPFNVTAGNLAIIQFEAFATGIVVNNITDSFGTTYLYVGSSSASLSGFVSGFTFYAVFASSGPNTVMITLNISCPQIEMVLWEFYKSSGTWALDQGSAGTGSAALTTSGPVTVSRQPEILAGYSIITNNPGAYGSGWIGTNTGLANGSAYQIVTANGSYTYTQSQSSSGNYVDLLVVFYASSVTNVSGSVSIASKAFHGVTGNTLQIKDATVFI